MDEEGLLDRIRCFEGQKSQPISVGFMKPGAIVVLASYMKARQAPLKSIEVVSPDVESYLTTVGLYRILWSIQDRQSHPRAGSTYSRLAELDTPFAVEAANNEISSCLKNFDNSSLDPATMRQFINVIGELHDNVWSHGKACGFSMIQNYRSYISFALADSGKGFLRVLQEAGVPKIKTHMDALKWCLKAGNSSTSFRHEDPWAQSIPWDCNDSPIPAQVKTFEDEDHHEGLGLSLLINLITRTSGYLDIISGNAQYEIRDGCRVAETAPVHPWQGVIIRFDIPCARIRQQENQEVDSLLSDLLS